MSWIWVIPVVVGLVGLGAGMGMAREMAHAARSLREEVERAGSLRPAIGDLQTELRRLRRSRGPGGRR